MDDWLLVAGDFTPLGGMDRANHALAHGLAARGHRVSLVTHRAWPDLEGRVQTSRVPRPRGSHLLGSPILASAGSRAARSAPGRVVVNGGNASSRDIVWVHYLHAAYRPDVERTAASIRRSAAHQYYLRRERASLRAARYVAECTRPTDRILALGPVHEVLVYARRGFAAGQAMFKLSLYTSDAQQRQALARLAAQDVPVVLADTDEFSEFEELYPLVASYLAEHYRDAGAIRVDEEPRFRVFVAVDRAPIRTDPALGLPCFA